jgi:hypothetical protein
VSEGADPCDAGAPEEPVSPQGPNRSRWVLLVIASCLAGGLLLHGVPVAVPLSLILLAWSASERPREIPRVGWRRALLGAGGPSSRGRRVLKAAFLGLVSSYLLVLAEPALLFAAKTERGRFRVHSDEVPAPALQRVLDRSAALLEASPLDAPALVQRFYLCGDKWKGNLLAPGSSSALAVNHRLLGTIVVNGGDVERDRIRSSVAPDLERTLSGVLAHEATHTLIREHLGLVASMRLPAWVKEGYCDYVSGESTLPLARARAMIAEGRSESSHLFFYARAHLLVRYLLEVEGWSVSELLERRIGADEVEEKLRSWWRTQPGSAPKPALPR